MTTKVTINRLATGVPGLDAVLGGGLPEYSFNVIAGPPGCGKTTLAHQLMFALATPQRPALYFTVMGEPPLKMLRYQQQFDFFDSDAVNRTVRFVNLADETADGDLDKVLRRIVAEVEALSEQRLGVGGPAGRGQGRSVVPERGAQALPHRGDSGVNGIGPPQEWDGLGPALFHDVDSAQVGHVGELTLREIHRACEGNPRLVIAPLPGERRAEIAPGGHAVGA